jgi:hypothetical protein
VKRLSLALVSLDVASDLRDPEVSILGSECFPQRSGSLFDEDPTVPIISINENSQSLSWEYDVRCSRQSIIMQPVPHSTFPKRLTKGHLGRRILSTHRGHQPGCHVRISGMMPA